PQGKDRRKRSSSAYAPISSSATCWVARQVDVPLGDGRKPAVAQLQAADAVDLPRRVKRQMQGSRGQQRHSVALVAVANTRNVPWPLVATAHLSMGAVEQAQPRRVQGVRFVDADRQWRFDVS